MAFMLPHYRSTPFCFIVGYSPLRGGGLRTAVTLQSVLTEIGGALSVLSVWYIIQLHCLFFYVFSWSTSVLSLLGFVIASNV